MVIDVQCRGAHPHREMQAVVGRQAAVSLVQYVWQCMDCVACMALRMSDNPYFEQLGLHRFT